MIDRSSNFVGIDVGGTTTRVGLVAPDGRVIASDRFETPRSADALVDRLAARIASLRGAATVGGVGFALPGPVDATRGVLVRSVNLPFLQGFPVAQELSRRTALRVTLMTDAQAATWGEYSVCHPSPAHFVHLRFGTGIACAIVVNGELQRTSTDRQSHPPELVVDNRADASLCACGLRGCLEVLASGPAVSRRANELGLPDDLVALQSSLATGQSGAKDLVDEIATWIVLGILRVADPLPALRPDTSGLRERGSRLGRLVGRGSERGKETTIVCLGGGVLQALPALFERVCELCRARDAAPGGCVDVRPMRLGDDAGVIGAALLAATT